MSYSHEVLILKAHGWIEDRVCMKNYMLLYCTYTGITQSFLWCVIAVEWCVLSFTLTSLSDVKWLYILCYKKLPASNAPVRLVKLTVPFTGGMTDHFVCQEERFLIYKISFRT
jgi:hypothetical protein